jgi:hypothetical protein
VRLPDVTDLRDLWRPDLVASLLGSGVTFDGALERAGATAATASLRADAKVVSLVGW